MDQDSRGQRAGGSQSPRNPADMSERVYEVRIAGFLSQQVLLQLPDIEVSAQELRTVLSGRFQDQAELHGFLARLRAFGLDVVEVRRVVAGSLDDERTADS